MHRSDLTKRQSAILNFVEHSGFVSTEDLVSKFEVTPQTIRRDLNELSSNGFVTRYHGGAGQVKSAENPPYQDRLQTGVEAKRRIAQTTAALIPNDASLFLGTGTTIEAIAGALIRHEKLHICTNNLHVAQILLKNTSFQVMVSCGSVRHQDGGIIGSSSDDYLNEFRMDFGIVGVSGIDDDGALLEYEPQEVKTAKTILKNSQRTILVADKHKFGRRAMNRVGHIRELDVIVTDDQPDAHFSDILASAGVDIIISG